MGWYENAQSMSITQLPERGGKVDRLWKSSGVSTNVAMKTFSSELVRLHIETFDAGRQVVIQAQTLIDHFLKC